MYADRIKGGTLTLGGSSNSNGLLQIVDAYGNVIGTWGVDGINATKGSFEGTIKSNSAEITGGTIIIESSESGKKIISLKSKFNESYMTPQGFNSKEIASDGTILTAAFTGRSAYLFDSSGRIASVSTDGINLSDSGTQILNIDKDSFISKNDIKIIDDWYKGWTITECFKDLYNRVSALEG